MRAEFTKNTHETVYLLSDTFRYDLLILEDAGPGYARNMNWSCDFLSNASKYTKDRLVVIDNRLEKEECDHLAGFIGQNPETTFLLSVVDPYYEDTLNHWYYHFLSAVAPLENVRLLSRYEPREFVRELVQKTSDDKLVFIPYPYRGEKCVDQPMRLRKNKVIISGRINQHVYPYRYKVWATTTRSYSRLAVDVLTHPGCPDIGQQKRHDITGGNYIKFLSGYRFMLLCPSRCELEFLKYGECAYAGCVPVGKAPASFTSAMRKAFIEIDETRISSSLVKLLWMRAGELEERALEYRNAFLKDRSVEVLHEKLNAFIGEHARSKGPCLNSPI